MKENKIGILSCGSISIVTLILSITFSLIGCNWSMNFCFAIMGSAFLSFIICLINYMVLRKKMIEDLVNDIYKFNNDSFAQFSYANNKSELDNLSLVVGIACSHLNHLIFLAYNIKTGLFKFEKRKKEILDKIINNLEIEIQFKFNNIGQYILKRPKKAEQRKIYLNKIIRKLLDDQTSYKLAFKLAKLIKTETKDVEETFEMSQKEFEVRVCDLIEKEIKVMQFKDDLKIKKKQIKKAKKDAVK